MSSETGDESCESLFHPLILRQDDQIKEQLDIASSRGFTLRPLERGDLSRGYLTLLSHLTSVGQVDADKFSRTFQQMKSAGTYYILTILDNANDTIIGTTTLFLEYKFIHSCSIRGRIEDVVIDETYRGQHLGKLLVRAAIALSKHLKCYKLSLDCSDTMKPFYTSLGFIAEEGRDNMLVIRLA